MCRFIAYLGQPILMDQILFRPKNSLIRQSIRALETEEPLNGDGFGIGWYALDIDKTPAIFTSIQPAWNEQNLMSIAPKIRSSCFFAHVRAGNVGGVSRVNCHPFHHDRFLFMHNGEIGDFAKIKRHIRRELHDDIYETVQGQTDSEHFFALFLETFYRQQAKFTPHDLTASLQETLKRLERIQKKYGGDTVSFINIALADGKNTVALRYTTHPELIARTLYYSAGSAFKVKNGEYRMQPAINHKNEAIIIASEKLTGYQGEWQHVPVNHVLTVNSHLSIQLKALDD